jgi:hypothetical protein
MTLRKTLTATLAVLTLATAMSATAASARPLGRSFGAPHHHGMGWGPAAAIGLGALAVGAIAASASYSGDCYLERRAVFDDYGNVIGYRRIRVCD